MRGWIMGGSWYLLRVDQLALDACAASGRIRRPFEVVVRTT